MLTLLFRTLKMLVGLSLIMVGLYKFVPVPYTPLMFERKIESWVSGRNRGAIQHNWVPATQIPQAMKRAVVAAEDAKFYMHNGFDMEAIEKAMAYNKTHTKKKGASTISQQTAKNVFLWPSRSWIRKGFEAYFTFLIEWVWGKERILEVYLNVIEIGPNVYGVEAAAKKYFKKSAKDMTASECALIASVLPNPIKWRIDSPGPYVLNRRSRILARMNSSARGSVLANTSQTKPPKLAAEENDKPIDGPANSKDSSNMDDPDDGLRFDAEDETEDEAN